MRRRSTIALLVAAAGIRPAVAQDAPRAASIAAPVKPVVFGEGHYDGEWGPQPHDFTMRRQAYWALLSGAAGHAYGAAGLWGWGDPQWGMSLQAAMNRASARQMKHVSDLLTPRAWHRLVPDLDGTVMTGGAGEGVEHAAAARTDDGSLVLAYLPTGRPVTIDMGRLSAPATARWFDPTNGRYSAIGGRLANSGRSSFTPRASNATGHSDWVLVLETASAAAAAPATPAFPLRVSGNGRHLVDRNGRPFLYQADTPWWMIWKGKPADIAAYLAHRKALGFTALQVMVLPAGNAPGGGNVVNAPDINGNRPFRDGRILDVTAVNEAYMKQADRAIRQASEAGFYLALAPAWFGSKGADYERYVDESNAAAWGHYLAKRYRNYPNIAWIMAGDSNAEGKAASVRAMAGAFKAVAPHQLVTAHAEVRSSSEQYGAESWLDFNMAYDYTWGGAWVHPQVRRAWAGQ